jgi:glycosyltransferase involved in cell wall biosynthesis
MRDIFILVPSFTPTAPVKGAVALANALAAERKVTLVALKNGPGADAAVDSRVTQISLADSVNGLPRPLAYRNMLRDAGGAAKVASISLCFSADMVNIFSRKQAVTCASVRGNLTRVYPMTYGLAGAPLAISHLLALRAVDHVVAMTSAMADDVGRFVGHTPQVIGNFVDEAALEPYRRRGPRDGPLRFVFVGFLTPLKRPTSVLDAIADLRRSGEDVRLDVIGSGPLRDVIAQQIERDALTSHVVLHGHLRDPYPLIAEADALVLPSISEGTSRAALEALYLGVPAVLRNTDGNDELVRPGENGMLFTNDAELPGAMLAAARLGRSANRESLLPPECRQKWAARRYLELVERRGR